MSEKDLTEHEKFALGLRQLANFYEAHPEIPLPYQDLHSYSLDTKDDAAMLAKALGTFEKKYSDDLLIVSKKFQSVNLKFYLTRDSVCTARVVGKKIEPEVYIPSQHIPAREVDVIEWDCHALNVNEEKVDG